MALPQAGDKVLAADLAEAFVTGIGAWTSFVPTLVQGVAVSKTTTQANYIKIGRLVIVNYALSCTSSGTAANQIRVGLPVTAAGADLIGVGSCMVFDTSATLFYTGTAVLDTTTTFKVSSYNAANFLGGASFTAALASGDLISAMVAYQSAS